MTILGLLGMSRMRIRLWSLRRSVWGVGRFSTVLCGWLRISLPRFSPRAPGMPNYRIEVWCTFKDEDAEDFLEDRVWDLLKAAEIRPQSRPVVYRMFGAGEPVRTRGT